MRWLPNSLDVLTNVIVIIAAAVFLYVVAERYILNPSEKPVESQSPRSNGSTIVGSRLDIDSIDFGTKSRNLILVLSKDCPYCIQSIPFYKELIEVNRERQGVALFAAFPHPVAESRTFLSDNELVIEQVVMVSPSKLGIKGTPAVILTDNAGVVQRVWVGALSRERESEVLTSL